MCLYESESWVVVPGYDGFYEASSLGRIRRSRGGAGSVLGRILTPRVNPNGYSIVNLCVNASHRSRTVHAIIAETFLGPRPDGMQVNHIDGDKSNNRPDNLEYVTARANTRHAKANGMMPDQRGRRQLKKRTVRAIRRRLAANETVAGVAKRFGLSYDTITRIRSGQTYSKY